MRNNKFKKIMIFLSILVLQPIASTGSFALARKRPMRAYSFIAEAGKASQGECDGEGKVPRLKRLKEYTKAGSYLGSELQTPEIKGKADGEMWKHFFRTKPACNTVLAKTPSSVDSSKTKVKTELPPEEPEDDTETTDGPDAE